MSESRGNLQRQIEELQSRMERSESLVRSFDHRLSHRGTKPQVRIARTVADSGGYPTEASGATAFPIKFRDPDFTESAGVQALGGPFLSASDQRVALTVPPQYVPKDQDVVVLEFDGKFYIIRTLGNDGDVHNVSADNGSPVTLLPRDTLDFDATDQDWGSERNDTKSLRGLVNIVEVDGVDPTRKIVRHAIDKSVVQQIILSGVSTGGVTPVLGRGGARNAIELIASLDSPILLIGTANGEIDISASNPFHYVTSEETGPILAENELDFLDELELLSECGLFDISKVGTKLTAKLIDAFLPIGCFISSYLEPQIDNLKYYLNRDGSPDTKWALADGSSNDTPGSGIKICDTSSGGTFFVRGMGGTPANADDTAYGRTALDPTTSDEVTFGVEAHPDHIHEFSADNCHDDPGSATPNNYDFSSLGPHNTSVQLTTGGGALTLDHTMNLTNNQGSAGDKVKMDPPYKMLWWFERVA